MTTSATRYRAPGFGASVMLSALHSPLVNGLRHNLCELRYQARRSGRPIALPVSYARMDHTVIVRVGRPESKTWWRNFRTPRPLSIWLDGQWYRGTGHVTQLDSLEREEAAAIYQAAFPRAEVSTTDPIVVIELSGTREPMVGAISELRTEPRGLWRYWFTSPLWRPGQSTTLVVLIGIAGGLLMAATMAAVTGYFLIHILRTPRTTA
ncbi:hypothetical protein ACQPZ2_22290 [Nocardia pseudovaccinii]|uniref:hypothetical protein n=1 Tax=Nocardia pseudovaccinii TaxID=189540 RepID=UPI003D92BAB5